LCRQHRLGLGTAIAAIISRTTAAITVITVGTVIGVVGVGSLWELALLQLLERPEPMTATAIGVMAIAIATKLIKSTLYQPRPQKRPGLFLFG
jgi:hypothetical protein